MYAIHIYSSKWHFQHKNIIGMIRFDIWYAKTQAVRTQCNLWDFPLGSKAKVPNILRDFRNAPFYIHCLFNIVNLRMFSLLFFILLHNGPWFAIISTCSCCSFWRFTGVSVFQLLSPDKCKFNSIWKQTLCGGSQMSYLLENTKSFRNNRFITFPLAAFFANVSLYSYGFLFNCTTVGQASDSMTALT